ncbi:hypothetical protein ACJJTC_012986 [Scirpophaga incertulas]
MTLCARGWEVSLAMHFFSCDRAGGQVADSPTLAARLPRSWSAPSNGGPGQEKFPREGNLIPTMPPSFKMDSKQKGNNPQVGTGQARESHTATAVRPQRNLGEDTNLFSTAPSARAAAIAPTTPAASIAPNDTNTAANNAPNTLLQSAPTMNCWQQLIVKKSRTNNPDNDMTNPRQASLSAELRALALQRESIDARLNDRQTPGYEGGHGGPDPIPPDEVRRLRKKRGKITARERKLLNRLRDIRAGASQRDAQTDAGAAVRDQRQVREEETQREKPPDAEASCQGQVREGATQREKPLTATEPTVPADRNRADSDGERPRRQKRRGESGLDKHTGSSWQPTPCHAPLIRRQGEPKRVRVQSGQGEQRTYALATKDIPARLAVAICFTPPAQDMTPYQGERVQAEIERLIMESDSSTTLPAFRGYPRMADGTVHMWCENEYALSWLTQHVPGIKLPDTDQMLTVMRQSDIPTRVRAALFVPRYNGDIARLQGILKRQNTWYDIGRWSLYRATSVGGDNQGTYLTLGIPPDEAEKVRARERRVSYLLGSIYVRFFPSTKPSEDQTAVVVSKDHDTKPQPDPTTTGTPDDDDDIGKLEEEMAKAAMAEREIPTPEPTGWRELLASSPNDGRQSMEGDGLSDESGSI